MQHFLTGFEIADVAGNDFKVIAVGPVFLLPGIGKFFFGGEVSRDDFAALVGQRDTNSGADAARASSDECDFLSGHIPVTSVCYSRVLHRSNILHRTK